jgi:hypothetical protein
VAGWELVQRADRGLLLPHHDANLLKPGHRPATPGCEGAPCPRAARQRGTRVWRGLEAPPCEAFETRIRARARVAADCAGVAADVRTGGPARIPGGGLAVTSGDGSRGPVGYGPIRWWRVRGSVGVLGLRVRDRVGLAGWARVRLLAGCGPG